MIIDDINAVAVGSAKKAKQTKERNASTTNEATETEAAKVAASWIIYLILTAVMAGFVGVILHGGIGGALTTFKVGNLVDIIITLILVYIPAQIILTYWLLSQAEGTRRSLTAMSVSDGACSQHDPRRIRKSSPWYGPDKTDDSVKS